MAYNLVRIPSIARYFRTATLKRIRSGTRSQWKLISTLVVWSQRRIMLLVAKSLVTDHQQVYRNLPQEHPSDSDSVTLRVSCRYKALTSNKFGSAFCLPEMKLGRRMMRKCFYVNDGSLAQPLNPQWLGWTVRNDYDALTCAKNRRPTG